MTEIIGQCPLSLSVFLTVPSNSVSLSLLSHFWPTWKPEIIYSQIYVTSVQLCVLQSASHQMLIQALWKEELAVRIEGAGWGVEGECDFSSLSSRVVLGVSGL